MMYYNSIMNLLKTVSIGTRTERKMLKQYVQYVQLYNMCYQLHEMYMSQINKSNFDEVFS